MLRVSDYNIYVPLYNEKKDYILIHGYLGSIDVVTEDIYILIQNGQQNPAFLRCIGDKVLTILVNRGYITHRTQKEEQELFKRIAGLIHAESKRYVNITLMPTYNCNFRCSYCYERSLLKKSKQWYEKAISKETVDRIYDWIHELKLQGKKVNENITLYGGEPLLRENYEIVKYILDNNRQKGYKLKAISNGHDLEVYESLLPDKIQSVQITLDGLGDYHNKKRHLQGGTPTFDKVVDNIDLCLKKGVKVNVRTNIDNVNIEQIGSLIEFYKAKSWFQNDNFTFYFKNLHECYMDKAKYVEEDKILDIIKSHGLSDNVYEFNNIASNLSNSFMSLLKQKRFALIRAGFCGATNSMYVIDPYGDIYPCWEVVGDVSCCMGSIWDNDLDENEVYKHWRNRTVQNIPQCISCKYAIFCGGGCPAHARVKQGDIYVPYCTEYKNIFHEVIPKVYKAYIKNNYSQSR